MELTRRQFIVGVTGCACAAAAGCVANSVPVFDANIDHTMPLPEALSQPGSQVKVRLPGGAEPVLVVRTKIGFNGTAAVCTKNPTDVQYIHEEGILKCLGCGSTFKLDGSVARGPANKPLKAYVVDLVGDKLKILG